MMECAEQDCRTSMFPVWPATRQRAPASFLLVHTVKRTAGWQEFLWKDLSAADENPDTTVNLALDVDMGRTKITQSGSSSAPSDCHFPVVQMRKQRHNQVAQLDSEPTAC